MKKQALIAAVLLGAAASFVAVLAASAGGGTRSTSAKKPITIGISLSLSGTSPTRARPPAAATTCGSKS